MSTVKISQLPILTRLDSNTSNTILVGIDKSTSVTGQFTAKVLADGLYANTSLNVGNNQITFPGTVAQFAGNNENYLQINLQNKNGSGSSDYVVTANNGTDSVYYGDFGIAGSTDNDTVYSAVLPLDTYLYAQGASAGDPGGNLVIGTATASKTIKFIAGGTSNTDYVAQLSTDGFQLLKKPLTFADGTTQNTSATSTSTSAALFANAAFLTANSGYAAANSGASFANGAFSKANSAASFANSAFLVANSGYDQANSSASFANGAFTTANLAYDVGVSASIYANGAFNRVNSSYAVANSGASFANGAFGVANSAASFANGAFAAANSSAMAASFANGAFDRANSGYAAANSGAIFANGAFDRANSAASFANGAFVVANSAASFANGAFVVANSAASFANGAFGQANSAASFANGAFVVANSAASFANGAFTSANSGWTKANSAFSLAGTQAGRLDVIEPIAQAAFTNAASALQNTSGTFDGTLHIARNFSVNGTVLFANSNFSATESAVTISASPTVATPSNDGYMIHISGKNGVPARVVTDSYGTDAYSLYAGRTARGNVANPTALQSGDVIARFSGNGYGTTKFQTIGVGRIDFVAAENFTDANTGSQIQFWNCPVGSNTLTNIANFNGDSVTVTGYIEPQKGFVYTPTVYPSAQTAITINMANNSVVRAQTSAGLVVTLSNLFAGKEVVAWITNTSALTQTFTHGVSALNSSVNATTYGIPGTSTILARYMSIDGTTQNTFVAITHA
jgi:hypothetical protein